MDTPSFEQALESDIKILAAEVQNQRERSDLANAQEKELIKEAIRAFPSLGERGTPAAVPVPTPNSSVSSAASSSGPLPAYAQNASAETKLEIEYLIDVALKHGIGKAVSESHKSPEFVQDAFHDALAGKLYPELQKRGIVK